MAETQTKMRALLLAFSALPLVGGLWSARRFGQLLRSYGEKWGWDSSNSAPAFDLLSWQGAADCAHLMGWMGLYAIGIALGYWILKVGSHEKKPGLGLNRLETYLVATILVASVLIMIVP